MKYSYAQVKEKANPMGIWYSKVVRPVTDFTAFIFANYTGIKPNSFTIFSFVLSLFAGFLFLRGAYIYDVIAAIAWQIAFCCDFIDGAVARLKNKVTMVGAFLDIFVDAFSIFWLSFCLLYSLLFTRTTKGNMGIVYISVVVFIALQITHVVITLLKDKLILLNCGNSCSRTLVNADSPRAHLLVKTILSKYLTRTDAGVMAFIIGPIMANIEAGFIIADLILIVHFSVSLAGMFYKLGSLDR